MFEPIFTVPTIISGGVIFTFEKDEQTITQTAPIGTQRGATFPDNIIIITLHTEKSNATET